MLNFFKIQDGGLPPFWKIVRWICWNCELLLL